LQIPASVISSVGTINYQQHQLFVVSKPVSASDSFAISTTASSVNAQNTFSVPSSVADGSLNSRMIQQTTNVQPPRLHPKKRKFDLAELEEENHQQQPSTPSYMVSTSTCNNPGTTISAPPVSTTLVYQRSVDGTQGQNGNGSHQATSGNYNPTYSNPTIVTTQVVKSAGEVQQVIKKQFTNYR
jgi:hypothetical protein